MKIFVAVIFVTCPYLTLGQFNMTEYRKMPPLFSFDDYDACLENPEPSTYCLVIAEVVPNATSPLWNQIANFSADKKRHYRHDSLLFGVCVNPCKELLRHLSQFQKEQLYSGAIKDSEVVDFFTDIAKRESGNRILHGKVINTCLNFKFKPQYDLQVRSFIDYCDTNDDPKEFDLLQIAFLVTLCTLLILAAVSTSYDHQLRKKECASLQGNDFYKQKLHTQRDVIFTSFSLYRNYYRLVEPSRSELAHDLRFFDGFRFAGTMLVVFAHVLLILKSVPTLNTEFTEKSFHRIQTNILLNGSVIIEVFFVMSSFLLCIAFHRIFAPKKPGFTDWIKLILYRYLRLTPSLGLMILLNASLLPCLQNGPYWRQLIEGEYVLCRSAWWTNLLYINNFTLRKSCMHQTWYLAADSQLYAIMAAVLIFITRFPKSKTFVLSTGVVISFLCTGIITYFLNLDAIHQETPESYRYFFWTDGETLYEGYVPFYMNFGGFFFGTITGMIYLKYTKEAKDIKKYKTRLNTLMFMCLPIAILMLLSGDIFYHIKFTRPSVWIGIYAGLFRNIWAILSCVIVLLMSFKLGGIMYKFSALKIFVPLGRLSYQVFLNHVLVIRFICGSLRQPLYVNRTILSTYILASVTMSFALAFFFYMFFELPLTTVLNVATRSLKQPTNTTELNLEPKKGQTDLSGTAGK